MNRTKYLLLIALLYLSAVSFGQTMVTGHVFSEVDGDLIGVQVLEVDKNNRNLSATTTDFNGNFSLEVKNTANSLKCVYVGYKNKLVPIGNNKKFNIQMEDDAKLAEVVVQGKAMHSDGTFAIPQREISGAVQKISTKAFEGLSVASIDDALQGRIAGLDIVSNSGNLGAGSQLRIRGTSTLSANAQPLIIVNDVPYENNLNANFDYASANQEQFANMLNINPEDIEEITVMKDGSTAAIWGAKGANGVIAIRTKKGVKGPTRVQYSLRFSGKKQPSGLKMLNGDDYTMMMKQAYFNPNQDQWQTQRPVFNYDPTFSEYQEYNENTDWVDAVTQYGYTWDHNLTVSGGGDKARFRMSFGYYDESGTVIEQQLKRFSTRMALDYQVSDRILFGSELAIAYTDNDKSLAAFEKNWDGSLGLSENLLGMAYQKMPNVAIYRQDAAGNNTNDYYVVRQNEEIDPEGIQNRLLNPVALAHLAVNDELEVRITPKLSLRYDILDPSVTTLRYSGYVSFDINNKNNKNFLPLELIPYGPTNSWADYAKSEEFESLSIYSDQNLTYSPNLGEDHSFIAYGSWQLSSVDNRNQKIESYGIPSSHITDPSTPASYKEIDNPKGQRRTMGVLGRVHYTYKGRYILDASIRRDGDTRFGYNNRWGNFPAVSGKWIISDEVFMDPSKSWLSELGIRAGFGIVGNSPGKDYLYYSRYGSYGSYLLGSAVVPSSLKLANLKWEQSSSYNLGLDVSLFDYKYTIDMNVYTKRTKDLLVEGQPIPSSAGFGELSYVNAGTVDNMGWEFNLSTNKMIQAGGFTVDVNMNLSNQINNIVSMPQSFLNTYNKDFNYENGSYLTRIQPNNALGSIYGFRYKGVYQYDKYEEAVANNGTAPVAKDVAGNVIVDSNGDPVPMYFAYGTPTAYRFRGGDAIYEDINHDGIIDELDIVYLGNSNPEMNGGFGTTIRYKNFMLNAFFNFRYGSKVLNISRLNAESMSDGRNQSIAVNWRWRKNGDNTEMPRALMVYPAMSDQNDVVHAGAQSFNSLGSDRYVEDGSFLRFKTLTFGYEFDRQLLRPWMLNQLNLYLTFNNLLTWTKYTGVDPEVAPSTDIKNMFNVSRDENKTPRPLYFTLGVTVGF